MGLQDSNEISQAEKDAFLVGEKYFLQLLITLKDMKFELDETKNPTLDHPFYTVVVMEKDFSKLIPILQEAHQKIAKFLEEHQESKDVKEETVLKMNELLESANNLLQNFEEIKNEAAHYQNPSMVRFFPFISTPASIHHVPNNLLYMNDSEFY